MHASLLIFTRLLHSSYHSLYIISTTGSSGRAVTLVTDARRKVVKDMLKSDAALLGGAEDMKGRVLSRAVPAHVVSEYATRLTDMEPALLQLSREEKMERQMRETEAELSKAQNLLIHEDEIAARPARTWYQTETQKQARREMTKTAVREERNALLTGNSKDLSATDKRNAIALADDYRDDGAGKKDSHRLSRKKRRRLAALEESAQADEEEASAERNSGRKPGLKPNAKVKAAAKKGKPEERSLAEMAQLREVKKRSRLQLEGRENVKKSVVSKSNHFVYSISFQL